MDILIAGVSARGLVESAVRSGSGHRIVAVDYFGDFDLQLLCEGRSIKRDLGLTYDVRHLMTASDALAFDALAYVANLENYPSVVEALGRGKPVLGNSLSALKSVRDPGRLFGFLERSGFPAPKISFTSPSVEPGASWLRKPLRSGGGHGIAVHVPGSALEPGCILQEHLDGLPCAAVFVANGKECCLLGISEQLIGEQAFGASGFRYSGSILGMVETGQVGWSDLIDRVEQVVRAISRAFHLVGVNGMDFVLKGEAIYPLEINPRYTASMELVERAYGVSIFGAHLAACQGGLPAFHLGAHYEAGFFGKAILFALEGLTFRSPLWWFERGARDLPFEGERIDRGKPVCTVFSRGRNRAECYDGLVKAAAEVYRALRDDSPSPSPLPPGGGED
ncbi:MAG: ATP-grasp domain-containing protein [Candidatus Methylomirabilis sp.]